MNSPQALENEHLRRQLDQTKRELSEVIDEVVFVERARADAEHRNVASTMRIAALEEELRLLKAANMSHYSPSRSSSQPAGGGGAAVNVSPEGVGRLMGLTEENALLRGEIAALQAQQLSHTDMTLSAQRATTARVEALARQLQNSEAEMDEMRRRLHQGGGGGNMTFSRDNITASQQQQQHHHHHHQNAGADMHRILSERNALEQRVTALEDMIRRSEAERLAHNSQLLQQANAAIGSATPGAVSSATSASVAQLIELRSRIETMARDAAARQAQVEQAIERLRVERGSPAAGAGPLVALDGGHQHQFASPASGAERTRLLAFEKTVQSLNVELASMEQKLRDMEALYQDQQARFSACKKDFDADQRECDQVVAAMAAELESMMEENAKLRQRLRSKTQQAAADAAAAAAATTADQK